MRRPVLERKIEQAHEALLDALPGTEYVFEYQDEQWTFLVVPTPEGLEDCEPVFVLNVESRGDWHEPR